jgi:cytochrome c-type biogenesis protein CcmE
MSPKILVAIAIGLAGVGILYVSLGSLGDNLVYYWTSTELVAAGDKALGANVRLGGMVEKDSISFDKKGLDLNFVVTDGATTVKVHGTGMPPQMFREGIGVVVEGTLTEAGVFESDRLLVKHDNQYKAPEDGREMDVEAMMKSMDGGDS